MNDFERMFEDHKSEDTRQFEIARDERKEIRHMILDLVQTVKINQESVLANQGAVSKAMGELKDSIDRNQEEMLGRLAPFEEILGGVLFGKKFLAGTAAVVLSLAAIGGAFIWVINSAIHR